MIICFLNWICAWIHKKSWYNFVYFALMCNLQTTRSLKVCNPHTKSEKPRKVKKSANIKTVAKEKHRKVDTTRILGNSPFIRLQIWMRANLKFKFEHLAKLMVAERECSLVSFRNGKGNSLLWFNHFGSDSQNVRVILNGNINLISNMRPICRVNTTKRDRLNLW